VCDKVEPSKYLLLVVVVIAAAASIQRLVELEHSSSKIPDACT
jgi:hypothetical protein